MNVYIDTITEQFLKQTITFCGIVNPIKETFTAKKSSGDYSFPYTRIVEGTVFTEETLFKILEQDNIRIISAGSTVFEKHSTDADFLIIHDPEDYHNLYNKTDKERLEEKLKKFEPNNNEMIYYSNTEKYQRLPRSFDKIVGVASGDMVARWAYEHDINNIDFYDYSFLSLKFQKQLVDSNDVKEVFLNYLPLLNTGQRSATMDDIKQLDFDKMQTYYDYLKNCNVSYGVCDIRDPLQLKSMRGYCDENTAVWLSNVYYYASSLNTNKEPLFKMLDNTPAYILPHTRVLYEG
jgi:hypothetical protein